MRRTSIAVLTLALFAVVAGVIAVVMWLGSGDSANTPTPSPSVTASTSTDPTPSESATASVSPSPTETAPPASPPPSPASTPDNRASVTPFIANAIYDPAAGTVTVYSFVPGLSEDTGTCTATFADGATTASGQSAASFEVSYTTCAPITVAVSSAPSSGATATVTFESTTSVGTSTPAKVTR